MQSFIFALLLAGVSGVTVVAFRHPHGYARLFPYLLAAASLVFVGVAIWQAAVEITWNSVEDYVAQEKAAIAQEQKSSLNLPIAWVVFWYVAAAGFLWIILKLPLFLQDTDKDDTPIEKEESQ